MEAVTDQLPPTIPSLRSTFKALLIKGGIAVSFRLTPPFISAWETTFTALINSAKPGNLPALAIVNPARHFLTHTPGSFFNLLSQKFTDAKKKGTRDEQFVNNEYTANWWFASHMAGIGLSAITIVPMMWTGDFFRLFGIEPIICNYVQDTMRAFAIGYPTVQAFSVNRQFIYSKCGDEAMREKFLLPFIGVAEAIAYGFFSYGFIYGGLGFNAQGLQGSGYALSISNTVALLGSFLLLLLSPNLRKYLLAKPDLTLIKAYLAETFKDGLPVMLRFVMENLSLISMAVIAGLVSQNELSALQICTTWLLPITSLGFSFITGIKAEITLDDPMLNQKVLGLIMLPTAFALLLLPFYAGIPKQLSSLFLSGHTPESRLAIENINEKALPLLASVEIANTAIHGTRAVLQKAKDLWYPAGTTFLFLCAAFIPTAYVVGKTLGTGLTGMAAAYLICMLGVMFAMALRFGYVLKNPARNAIGCWAMLFPSQEPEEQRLLLENSSQIQGAPSSSIRLGNTGIKEN